MGVNTELLPNTPDWFGRYRMKAGLCNDWEIDREAQRTESYTGIDGIHLQDQAITESMGPVIERELEHLVESVKMIVEVRKALISAARTVAETGETPTSAGQAELFLKARGGQMALPTGKDWQAAYHAKAERFGAEYLT